MKKFISLIILFISFSFVFVSNIYAAGGFTLSNGQFENAPGESEEYRIIAQDLFTALTINVSESGEVIGEEQVPFSFELNGDSYSGQASIKLNGTYDFDKRSIKGNFTYKHSRVRKGAHKSGNAYELKGSRNTSDDKFNGTIDGDVSKIEFARIGNVIYTDTTLEGEKKIDIDISDLPDVEYQPDKDSGARFINIQGEVKIYPDGNPEEVSFAKSNIKIAPGTHIFTGEESSVTLTFADLSTYKVPPNSEIVIRSFDSKSPLSLATGKIWGNIKKIASGETIEIRTNQAVTGIKGTTFVLEEKNGKTVLKVIEGLVSFKSLKTGAVQKVKTGESLFANKDGLGQKTNFNVETENGSWEMLEKQTQKQDSIINKITNIFQVVWQWLSSLFK